MLEIDDFEVEWGNGCIFDYFAIKEGDCPSINCHDYYYYEYYSELYPDYYYPTNEECDGTLYCGNPSDIPTEITVQQNKACLTFYSDYSVQKRGFHITAKGKSKL